MNRICPNLYPKKMLCPKYDKYIYNQYTKEAKQWYISMSYIFLYIYIYIYIFNYSYGKPNSIIIITGVKSVRQGIVDCVLLPKRTLGRLLDVNVWRGEGEGMSDHFLVEAQLKLVIGWWIKEFRESVRNVLKLSELNNSVKERAYQGSLRGDRECGEGVAKAQRYSNGVHQWCVWHKTCDGQGRKGSELENEEVGGAVAEKKRALAEWLQRRDRVTYHS